MDQVRMIPGDVADTLAPGSTLPEAVCVLRLDTDWYASTLIELEALYPRLCAGGVLLLDDYGHWDGQRRAVEEYFERPDTDPRPFLPRTDYTGRSAVKGS
jgi:hypothetical protein